MMVQGRTLWAVVWALGLFGCGGSSKISVELSTSSVPELDPQNPDLGLLKIRVTFDGPERNDDVILELSPNETQAVIEQSGGEGVGRILVEGIDAQGNAVAYGRADDVELGSDVSLTIPFRRNLAYVGHRPNPAQMSPESHLYLIDVSTRSLVQKVRIPGNQPIARSVSARGGQSMLVTYDDGALGFVGSLSTATNEWTVIPLPELQDLALAVPGEPVGVVVGGGTITFVDFDRGEVVGELGVPVGGTVLDGVISRDGSRALVVVDVAPGLVWINLSQRTARGLDAVAGPGGVALGPDGFLAYVTSQEVQSFVSVHLIRGSSSLTNFRVFRSLAVASYSPLSGSVYAVQSDGPRVFSYRVPPSDGLQPLTEAVAMLTPAAELVSDAAGRRLVSVSSGTSTTTATLTVIDAFQGQDAEGSSLLYPVDPEDTFTSGGVVGHQRYQPQMLGVIYGR